MAAGLKHGLATLETGREDPRRDRKPMVMGACPIPIGTTSTISHKGAGLYL